MTEIQSAWNIPSLLSVVSHALRGLQQPELNQVQWSLDVVIPENALLSNWNI